MKYRVLSAVAGLCFMFTICFLLWPTELKERLGADVFKLTYQFLLFVVIGVRSQLFTKSSSIGAMTRRRSSSSGARCRRNITNADHPMKIPNQADEPTGYSPRIADSTSIKVVNFSSARTSRVASRV